MSKQYDVSPQQLKLTEEKTQRKLDLRNTFLKLKSDPFIQASGEGGHVVGIQNLVLPNTTDIMRYI